MKMTTLKGIFPDPKPVRRKNFIHENMKSLRRMEQCFQVSKQMEELKKLQLHKHRRTTGKYENVSARVVTSLQEKKHQSDNIDIASKSSVDSISIDNVKDEEQPEKEIDISEPNKKHVNLDKKVVRLRKNNDTLSRQKKQDRISKCNSHKLQSQISSEPNIIQKVMNAENITSTQNIIKYRNQGIQTLDTDQADSIYSEGVIWYPSKKITKHNEVTTNGELNRDEEKISRKQSDSPTDRGDMRTSEITQKLGLRNSTSPALREEIDFIKLNKERISVANKLATQLNNDIPHSSYRKGIVPKYLRDRKEAQQKEQKAKAETTHLDCPEGHIPLPEHERKETLRLLKKNYQDYVNELNLMPIKTDTLRAQRRKIEIERQLNKLEEGIKVFSRPKVYVKVDE